MNFHKYLTALFISLTFLACGTEEKEYSNISIARSGTETVDFRPVASSCLNPGLRPPASLCSFYRECLEASITCEDTNFPYAITFGERNCKNFESNRPDFSDEGKKWLDGTLVCLHEIMGLSDGNINSYGRWNKPRPSGDPNATGIFSSCKATQQAEFDGHPGCYLGGPSRFSGRVHPSICSLSMADTAEVLHTLEGRDMFTKAAVPQMIAVGRACIAHYSKVSGFSSIRGTRFAGLARIMTSSENQKLLDLWTWKEASWVNISKGLNPPPPPQSLEEDIKARPHLVPTLPPIIRPAGAGFYKVAGTVYRYYYAPESSYCVVPFMELYEAYGSPTVVDIAAIPGDWNPKGECRFPEGQFKVGETSFYSNGSDAYCRTTHTHTKKFKTYPRIVNSMADHGTCPELPAKTPGFYRVGTKIYFAEPANNQYCGLSSMVSFPQPIVT